MRASDCSDLINHASEERLFSHRQGQLACACYMLATFAALALSVPYWHLLGLT